MNTKTPESTNTKETKEVPYWESHFIQLGRGYRIVVFGTDCKNGETKYTAILLEKRMVKKEFKWEPLTLKMLSSFADEGIPNGVYFNYFLSCQLEKLPKLLKNDDKIKSFQEPIDLNPIRFMGSTRNHFDSEDDFLR